MRQKCSWHDVLIRCRPAQTRVHVPGEDPPPHTLIGSPRSLSSRLVVTAPLASSSASPASLAPRRVCPSRRTPRPRRSLPAECAHRAERSRRPPQMARLVNVGGDSCATNAVAQVVAHAPLLARDVVCAANAMTAAGAQAYPEQAAILRCCAAVAARGVHARLGGGLESPDGNGEPIALNSLYAVMAAAESVDAIAPGIVAEAAAAAAAAAAAPGARRPGQHGQQDPLELLAKSLTAVEPLLRQPAALTDAAGVPLQQPGGTLGLTLQTEHWCVTLQQTGAVTLETKLVFVTGPAGSVEYILNNVTREVIDGACPLCECRGKCLYKRRIVGARDSFVCGHQRQIEGGVDRRCAFVWCIFCG